MPIIRKVEIRNFRGIASLDWFPGEGINCLIGPGDSCKTTILDAIDLCLGARRNLTLHDADFHALDVQVPIEISITLGRLNDTLKNLESYGLYLRGFDKQTRDISDEPDTGLETVLTVRLSVEADLEPSWTLVSERATQQAQSRSLSWSDRAAVSPTRLGAYADNNLSWGRTSILNKISDETIAATAALADLARNAREAFGQQAEEGLPKALAAVQKTATDLGVPVGDAVKAMLDSQSVSFSGGTIALHNSSGIPLKNLGLGSKRLLVAGLQRSAAGSTPIVLVDEIEHGLEPHRIIRLLDALGAKESKPPLQAFLTTHSPVAVRELNAQQLHIVRTGRESHNVFFAGTATDVQGTIRLFPSAMLARSVLVCEGPTEIGFIRGLDQYRSNVNYPSKPSITALAAALVDGNGAETFKRAIAFQTLGYRTAVLLDSDTTPTPDLKVEFEKSGGTVFSWSVGCCLEEELFNSLSDGAALALLDYAVEAREAVVIDNQIRSTSGSQHSLASCRTQLNADTRSWLGKSAKAKKTGWFKSIAAMEPVARDIVAPDIQNAKPSLANPVRNIFKWFEDGTR